jgi:hypothetical protein
MSAIVKFGAEDIGLEKTLKKVQTELSDLKDKVKGGDQSLSELEGTMKRIGELDRLEKRLNAMGDEADKASPKVDELGDDAKTMGNKAEDAGQKGETGLGKIGIAAGVAGAAFAAGMKVLEVAADAARAVVDNFGQALDLGGELSDLSARTGESAGQLLILQRAFENSGVSADKVGTSVNKLQKFMEDAANGGEKQSKVMNDLGITYDDLIGKTPTEQMQIFAEKISGIQDPTERAATAMTVFGKSGGELLPLLTNFSGEVETAKEQLGGMPGIMDRTAGAFDAISDNLSVAKGKLTEFAAGMLEGAAPALEKFSEMLTGVDAAGWGQKLGEAVTKVADLLIGAFKSPQTAIDAISAALEAGVKNMGNLLLNSFINAGRFFSEFFSSEMPALLANQFGTGLKSAINSGIQFFVDGLLGVIRAFDTDFGKSSSGIVNFFKDSFASILKLLANDWVQVFTNPLAFVSGQVKSALTDAFNGGGVTFKSALTDGVETSLGKLSSGLGESAERYSQDFQTGTEKIGAEWDKITGNIEISAKDFFGAEEASQRTAEKLKEIEGVGTAFRESLTKGTDEAAKNAEKIAPPLKEAERASDQMLSNIFTASADLVMNAGDAKDKFTEIKSIGDLIAAQDVAKPAKTMAEAAKEVRTDLKNLKDFIGDDLSKAAWPDVAEKLGIDTTKKKGSELVKEIKQKLEDLKNTPLELRIDPNSTYEDIESIKRDVAEIGRQPVKVNLEGELENISSDIYGLTEETRELNFTGDESLNDISQKFPEYFGNPLELAFDADMYKVEKSIDALKEDEVDLKLDASTSITSIRKELSKEIDLSLSSSTGSDILKTISTAVSAIKDAVYSLEKKLPQPSIAY